MPDSLRGARIADVEAISQLAGAIRRWEPAFELYVPARDARLFEPEGTLYAIALAATATVTLHHRVRIVRRGDLIVLPQGFALDLDPEVDVLAIRHDGPPPDHFRERFIQVWGFEHLSATGGDEAPAPAGVLDLIAGDDLRHPLAYSVLTRHEGPATVISTRLESSLLIGLEGSLEIDLAAGGDVATLAPGWLALVEPQMACRVRGEGRFGVLRMFERTCQELRRGGLGLEALRRLSPEFDPQNP